MRNFATLLIAFYLMIELTPLLFALLPSSGKAFSFGNDDGINAGNDGGNFGAILSFGGGDIHTKTPVSPSLSADLVAARERLCQDDGTGSGRRRRHQAGEDGGSDNNDSRPGRTMGGGRSSCQRTVNVEEQGGIL